MSTPAPTRAESADAVEPSGIRSLAKIAVFAALIAVLGMPAAIPVPCIPVPITLQTLGVMLAGAVLGAWRGAASVVLLLVLTLIGLPLLAGGRGGPGVFVGPSAGYLFGWILGAFVVGAVIHGLRATPRPGRPAVWRVILGTVLGGILAIYLIGIPVQSAVTGIPLGESIIASMAFLPGDLVKAAVTTLLVVGLGRAYPRAFA